MEKEESKTPWRRLGLLLGILAAIFILIFGGLVVFDLGSGVFYNVMLAKSERKSLTEELKPEHRASDAKTKNTRRAEDRKPSLPSTQTTTSSIIRLRAEAGLRSLADATTTGLVMNRDRVMIPDGTFKTHKFDTQARKLNEDYARALQEFNDFCRMEKWKNFGQGNACLVRLKGQCYDLRTQVDQALKNLNQEEMNLIRTSTDLNQVSRRVADCSREWYEKLGWLSSNIEASEMMVCVVNEQWAVAANMTRHSQGTDNWKMQVLFLSQMGARGQALIAQRSAERNWTALKRSVMSIGPDFKLPYHERWD